MLVQFPVGVNLRCGADGMCDCLYVYDGSSTNSTLLQELCGPHGNYVIVSSSYKLCTLNSILFYSLNFIYNYRLSFVLISVDVLPTVFA